MCLLRVAQQGEWLSELGMQRVGLRAAREILEAARDEHRATTGPRPLSSA